MTVCAEAAPHWIERGHSKQTAGSVLKRLNRDNEVKRLLPNGRGVISAAVFDKKSG